MGKRSLLGACAGLAMIAACGAEGGADAASEPDAGAPALSAEQQALLPPMKRYETDFVTIDLPEGMDLMDESYLGSIGLYGEDDTLAFELFTVKADSVSARLEKEASHPTGLFQSFGWEERGREALGEGVLVTGMGGGTSSQPNRPVAFYVGPDGKSGLIELTVKTAFGTDVAPERVFALAEAMATSMVVDDLPDETSYAAFRSSRFGEAADVPYEEGVVDVEKLRPLTLATLESASGKALAFAEMFDRAGAEDWLPDRVREDLIPLAQDAATDHRALKAYGEAWGEVLPKGDPNAPAMRALGLVGDAGYSFLWDLAGHVTRVAELKDRGRDEALAELRADGTGELDAQRELYAYALAAYAAAKDGNAAPQRPRFADAARGATAAQIEEAASDMRLAKDEPKGLAAKYAEADRTREAARTGSGGRGGYGPKGNLTREQEERRKQAVARHILGGRSGGLNTNAAGLDPFSNVNVVRVYGGMSLDPWD